jgi:hypothetical protein
MPIFYLLSFLFISSVHAVVNYQNGNYFQEFIDVNLPLKNQKSFLFKRSYNSASDFDGIFGRGWGSSFETRLSFIESAIVIQEMGSGRHYVFVPKGKNLEKALETTLAKIQNKTQLKGDALAAFKTRILLDPQALQNENTSDSGSSEGEYENLNNPFLTLKFQKGVITFTDPEGSTWNFLQNGQLKSLQTSSGLKFEAKYQGKNLESLYSSELFIQIERNPHGALKAIKFGPVNVTYKVEKEQLLGSVDQNKKAYKYTYENGKLVKVKGPEINESITYHRDTGKVESVIDANGAKTSYSFKTIPGANPVETVEVQEPDMPKTIFEYENRIGKQGPYLYRRKITRGRSSEEIVFDDCCGRPVQVKRNNRKDEYKYTESGLPLWMKSSDGQISAWQWEGEQLKKFVSPGDEREYQYDKNGIIKVSTKTQGVLNIKRNSAGWITEGEHQRPDGSLKIYRFNHSPDGKLMSLLTEKGKKATMRLQDGKWEVDSSQTSDLGAQMELMGWLQLHQEFVTPPQPII